MAEQEIGVMTDERRQVLADALDDARELEVWDREDAPPGSTRHSLLVFRGGVPVRVAGPTHYHHLADGRVLPGYNGGTHYDDGSKVTRIVAVHEG